MMSKAISAQVSEEAIKKYLKNFSKFLRRDFLAILVKMCSRELGIKTVREDWRTRTGMLNFLQSVWPRFVLLASNNTVVRWYCTNFDLNEKVLSNRKFALFLYSNWSAYGQFLTSEAGAKFLRVNQVPINSLLEGTPIEDTEVFNTEEGKVMTQIINHFRIGLTEKTVPVVQPTPVETKKQEEMSFSPEVEYDSLDNQCRELEIQDTFEPTALNLDLYDQNDFLSAYDINTFDTGYYYF